jgi:hypothetical protein
MTSLVRALVTLSLFSLVQSAEICPLCETLGDFPKRWGFQLKDGRTCQAVYSALLSLDGDSSQCQAEKQVAQELCCGEAEPDPFDLPPGSAPVYSGPSGDEPNCPICGTMEYPGLPNVVIQARYVGQYSCGQFFDRGMHGMTPSFMCGPLQNYAEERCGCGDFHPECKADSTQCWRNNPAPQAAPQTAPNPSPVVYVEPTFLGNRKTPPETGKYVKKLSHGRGGAGTSSLRAGNRRTMEKGAPVQVNHLPEIDDQTVG